MERDTQAECSNLSPPSDGNRLFSKKTDHANTRLVAEELSMQNKWLLPEVRHTFSNRHLTFRSDGLTAGASLYRQE